MEDNKANTVRLEDKLYDLIAYVVRPIVKQTVQPELHYKDGHLMAGRPIPEKHHTYPGFVKRYGKEPLEPRFRLSARLTLMLVLTRLKNELAKEILEDKEAVEDARKHKMDLGSLET